MQGLNLKRILGTGPYCTSAPVSPLCHVLDGCNTIVIFKEKNLGETCRAKKLVILDKPLEFKISQVELN